MSPRRRNRRNLVKRGSVWYFEKIVDGHRYRRSLETANLDEAIARRDTVERELALKRFTRQRCPTFSQVAREALRDMDACRDAGVETGYAATTARDRHNALKDSGPVLPSLGHLRLDQIDAPVLRRWHDAEVIRSDRSLKTGSNLLDAIEQVLRFARARGYIDRKHNPVSELREQVRAERRTKRSRQASEERRRFAKDGVLSPREVGRLTLAARRESAQAYVVVLLAVECGLRRSELAGLSWGDVAFGTGPDDPSRAIEIRHARPRGEPLEAPKSGRIRRPHISRRLWFALDRLHKERWRPGPNERLIASHYSDLQASLLRRVLIRAGLPHRTFQNLRATCSSLLKQWGVAPEYVRAAIGHESDGVARKHYDRLDFTTYREPERLQPGQTPMDLFARLCEETDEIPLAVPSPARKPPMIQRVGWRPQRDSNPCCRLERAES